MSGRYFKGKQQDPASKSTSESSFQEESWWLWGVLSHLSPEPSVVIAAESWELGWHHSADLCANCDADRAEGTVRAFSR